jgi:FtsP/CotA-like multicopper oxidase with cupredoxin domain
MPNIDKLALSRRGFFGAGGLALAAVLPARPPSLAAGVPGHSLNLTSAPARILIVATGHLATRVWAYNGSVPGPVLRVPQGEPVEITVANGLAEPTTVHWHGIRLPNAMDGVPGISQSPIQRGDRFTYAFTPPDAGTFWYHSHADSLRQLGMGLAGALIVEERDPPAVDRELVWVIQDWRLDEDAQIAPGFGNRMEAGMSGRVGNTVTINGRVLEAIRVRAGERIRLRLINAASARIVALDFTGHRPVVVAHDGQPCEPHAPPDGRVLLGPGMRVDLILDMTAAPESRHAVRDDFYGDRLAYKLVDLAYDKDPFRAAPPDSTPALPPNPLPQPDMAAAERHEITMDGGMMSGMGGMMGMMGARHATWAMNGMSMTGDGAPDMAPLFTVARGRTCVLALRNETAWWHPMHLHGHSFRVLTRDDAKVPHREWRDTVLMPPRSRAEIAFVAERPGDWMFHCHVTDHQMSGMMAVIRIA